MSYTFPRISFDQLISISTLLINVSQDKKILASSPYSETMQKDILAEVDKLETIFKTKVEDETPDFSPEGVLQMLVQGYLNIKEHPDTSPTQKMQTLKSLKEALENLDNYRSTLAENEKIKVLENFFKQFLSELLDQSVTTTKEAIVQDFFSRFKDIVKDEQ